MVCVAQSHRLTGLFPRSSWADLSVEGFLPRASHPYTVATSFRELDSLSLPQSLGYGLADKIVQLVQALDPLGRRCRHHVSPPACEDVPHRRPHQS